LQHQLVADRIALPVFAMFAGAGPILIRINEPPASAV
jgi:hypothetical protein